jgi:hypothetical protein
MTRSALCAAGAVLLTCIVATPAFPRPAADNDAAQFPVRVLAAHNAARAAAGLPSLEWDNALGAQAARYAFQLAISNRFEHSTAQARNGSGENLWMGSRGAFSAQAMVGDWVSERSHFRPGVFPVVSRTGNWHDVGHYTQIVWPTTQKVGCALATNAQADYLVCHYWPAGNIQGVAVSPAAVRLAGR